MLKLLIIDDMPIIADGLYDLFCEEQRIRMEVFKAYSAPAGLEILQQTPIDIIVSDIKMPEMSGLELLREVNRLWPHCRVIFLTSYHDFEFAREAITLGGFDFILKTEGDARIVESVYKAADEITQERSTKQLIAKAQEQYRLALPSLQQNYLIELLQGKHKNEAIRAEQFQALEIGLDPVKPVHLVIARLDKWKQSMTWSDQALLLYSVQNIMNEYLSPKVRMVTVNLNHAQIVGMWQPLGEYDTAKESSRAFRFFFGTLETVQNTCRELLKLQMSFVLKNTASAWDELGEGLHKLTLLMQSGIGLNLELLTTDEELELLNAESDRGPLEEPPLEPGVFLRFVQYLSLPVLLAGGKKEEFLELYEDLVQTVNNHKDHLGIKLEALHYLAYIFLGYMNRRRMLAEIFEKFEHAPITGAGDLSDWNSCAEYYRKLALYLFEHSSEEQEHRSIRLVQDIQHFVLDNLEQDLSLTRLGDQVHLNPAYLSRLYKQITGNGISEYIMEARIDKAKYLLENSNKKIHEIAEDTGYQSGVAFTRFFKKMLNVTPQEYRDTKGSRRN